MCVVFICVVKASWEASHASHGFNFDSFQVCVDNFLRMERKASTAALKCSIDVDTKSIAYTIASIRKSKRQNLELPNWKETGGNVTCPSAVGYIQRAKNS